MKKKLCKLLACGMAVFVAVCGLPAYALADTANTEKDVSEKAYVVTVATKNAYNYVKNNKEILEADSAETADNLENRKILVVNMTSSEAASLRRRFGVKNVEENIEFKGSVENSDSEGDKGTETLSLADEWNMDALGVNEETAQTSVETSDAVKVAVLDSGIAMKEDIDVTDHIDLTEEAQESPFFEDTTGHGTSVASVIAAKQNEDGISGINPNADLYSVKILDDDNKADLSTVVAGIYWCIDNDINIINMSFGTSQYSSTLESAIEAADNAGILMVAAAGNNGETDKSVDYPAAFPQVLSVGATDAGGSLSESSSAGEQVDLAAPGENIPAAGFFEDVISASGTSMAVPHVTGIASVLWAKDKTKSNHFIKDLLKYSSRQLDTDTAIGMPDLAFALEHYDSFAENYQDNAGTNTISINPSEPEDYRDAQVYAKWNTNDHYDLITDVSTSSAAKIMATAAKYTDSNSVLQYDKKFHGGGNYVLNFKYLYKIAYQLRNDSNTDVLDILDSSMISNANLTSYEKKGLKAIKTDLTSVLKEDDSDSKLGQSLIDICGANTRLKKSYMIMGIACHIAADTYAHRVLPKKTLDLDQSPWTFVSDYMTTSNYKQLKSDIGKYLVEFRDFKCYPSNDTQSANLRRLTEDSTSRYPSRYTEASSYAMSGIYYCFITKEFVFGHKGTIISKVFGDENFTHKLNNLLEYARADNTITSTTIVNLSTSDYRYNPIEAYTGKNNDYDHADYPYTDRSGSNAAPDNYARYGE